jgi:hypothetical protein
VVLSMRVYVCTGYNVCVCMLVSHSFSLIVTFAGAPEGSTLEQAQNHQARAALDAKHKREKTVAIPEDDTEAQDAVELEGVVLDDTLTQSSDTVDVVDAKQEEQTADAVDTSAAPAEEQPLVTKEAVLVAAEAKDAVVEQEDARVEAEAVRENTETEVAPAAAAAEAVEDAPAAAEAVEDAAAEDE